MRLVQDRLGPLHHGRGHVDDDEIEVGARHVEDAVDVFGTDDVERQHLGRRRHHVQLLVESQERLEEAHVVDRRGVGQHLVDRFPARQVEIGRDRAILEVEIQKADARRIVLLHRREFPGKVDRERRRTGAAGKAVNRDDHAVAVALRLEARRRRLRFGKGLGRRRLVQPLDGFVQRVLGKRVGHEIVGAELQELVQRDRADLLGDEDDLDALFLCGGDDPRDAGKVVLVLRIHGDGHEFESIRVRLVQEEDGVVEGEIAPAFAKLGFHVFDQEVEIADIPRDRACHDRRRLRLQRCYTAHSHTSFSTWRHGTARSVRFVIGSTGPNPDTLRDSLAARLLSGSETPGQSWQYWG